MPGIWTSRRTRSGRRSSISAHRFRPVGRLADDLDVVDAAQEAAQAVARQLLVVDARSVREHVSALPCTHRNAQRDRRAVTRLADHLRRVVGAVQPQQAIAHVAQADAALEDRALVAHADAGVAHRQAQVAVVDARLDRHPPAADLRRDAVLDGVLDQRLQDQARQQQVAGARVDVLLDRSASPKRARSISR